MELNDLPVSSYPYRLKFNCLWVSSLLHIHQHTQTLSHMICIHISIRKYFPNNVFPLFTSAETMMRSPPRSGRSLSPEAALSAQAEARRLAAYPGAKIPDVNSEPAIDRYDWPAPPSPAVVMIDRRKLSLPLACGA